MIDQLSGHVACAALVAADLFARSLRLRWLTGGTGHSLSLWSALRTNLFADAGATLSPMRLAGEPARIAGMRLAGVPLPATVATIAWELIAAWPTVLLISAILFYAYAPTWWNESGPELLRHAGESFPIIGVIVAAMLASVVVARRLRPKLPARVIEPLAMLRTSWRAMPLSRVLASVPLSAVNVLSRTALLPILAVTLPNPPQPASLWIGSFLLVYGQLIIPTPAGAGAVELGFMSGAAGDVGGSMSVLIAWRWWTNGVPALLGVLAVLHLRHRTGRTP